MFGLRSGFVWDELWLWTCKERPLEDNPNIFSLPSGATFVEFCIDRDFLLLFFSFSFLHMKK